MKYIDDCLTVEKVYMKKAEKYNIDGHVTALSVAPKTQAHFRTVEYNAENRGMQINNEKTVMLCVSAARSYVPECYIHTSRNDRITSTNTLKVLGFTFGNEPNVKAHVAVLLRKFRSRIWALRHLKRNGYNNVGLVVVYASMIRSLAEYCSSVYHTLITASDSLEIERLQMQALKTIFGWQNSYEALLRKSGLERLDVRRESAFKLLAKQMSESARYVGLFPLNPDRRGGLRNREKYKIYPARTSRFLSSPLNSMRRYLNEVHSS